MIIKDIYGDSLQLTKTHLKEILGSHVSEYPYRIRLSDLRKRWVKDAAHEIPCHGKDANGNPNFIYIGASRGRGYTTIGCRKFYTETFNKILKAAGIRVPKTGGG